MVLHAEAGEDISALLKTNGFPFVCGGMGTCGKCKIRVLSGSVPVTDADRAFFSACELENGWRLACRIDTFAEPVNIEYEAVEEQIHIPDVKDISDRENFSKKENGTETENRPEKKNASEAESSSEPEINKKDNSKPGSDMIDIAFSLAIDIGTTTLAAAAVRCDTGEVLDIRTGINHQRSFGADVVSRIVASNLGNGPAMRDAVIRDINGLIGQITESRGLTPSGLKDIIISGNTTMQHIFAGYSCEGLGVAPFKPVSIKLTRTDSGILLPGISAFVGADIVAGIYYCGFGKELSLLIDLGTNGEMALGTAGRILVASTAAGPAFEGGNISCGTAGIPGAVYDVDLSDNAGDEPIVLKTIGDAKEPVGICGTGVIALTAELLRNGLIDETGLLDERLHGRIRLTGDKRITFTQKDIRELQLAVAAIRGGTDTLLEEYGACASDIKHVFIAGGFGAELDLDKAAMIGLIPEELKSKCISVGNSSLKGAIKYASEPDGAEALDKIVNACSEIILADSEKFTRYFLEHMNFKKS